MVPNDVLFPLFQIISSWSTPTQDVFKNSTEPITGSIEQDIRLILSLHNSRQYRLLSYVNLRLNRPAYGSIL